MILFPAIDIRHGKCVRLLHGDPATETVYSEDPADVAMQYQEQGAQWLHVVNLDGAFDDPSGDTATDDAIQAIVDSVDIPVQVGGGLRTFADIEYVLNMGVTRVVLGTFAVERTRQLPDVLGWFGPEQILVGIDARNGKVATHGWQKTADVSAIEFGKEIRAMGITHVVHTDISRDGALSGINLPASLELAEKTGLKVIISGGVASLNDVRWANSADGNIEGLIVGKALYSGAFTLPEALAVLRE